MYTLNQFAQVIKAVSEDLKIDVSEVEFKVTNSKSFAGKYINRWQAGIQPGTYKPELWNVMIKINMNDTIQGICDTIAHELRHMWQDVFHIEWVRQPWRRKEYCSMPGFAKQYFMGKKVVTKYEDQVIEIDANAYAKEAVIRLNLCALVTKD